jgi:pimeloyl-ACP methyl ester carboxylesterase
VDTPSQIFVYHPLLAALRQGRLGATFDKVVLVGHSYGAVIAFGVANRYPDDVDGVIIASLQHEFDDAFLREFWGTLHPARDEGGRFAGLDSGYLTSRPGERHGYYHVPGADPRVIQLDEATKETFTTADARTLWPIMGESSGIVDPVLDVIGEFDRWFCAGQPCSSPTSTSTREHNWFGAAPCFEQYIVPEAGHSLNTSFSAQKWFAVAVEWTHRMVAAEGPCH